MEPCPFFWCWFRFRFRRFRFLIPISHRLLATATACSRIQRTSVKTEALSPSYSRSKDGIIARSWSRALVAVEKGPYEARRRGPRRGMGIEWQWYFAEGCDTILWTLSSSSSFQTSLIVLVHTLALSRFVFVSTPKKGGRICWLWE
jgi:hypothetical protein